MAAAAGTAVAGLAGMGQMVVAGAAAARVGAVAEARWFVSATLHVLLYLVRVFTRQQFRAREKAMTCAPHPMQRCEEHGGPEEGRQRQRGGRGGRGEGKSRGAAPKMAQAKRLFTNNAALVRLGLLRPDTVQPLALVRSRHLVSPWHPNAPTSDV